jgi:hypothetical protein
MKPFVVLKCNDMDVIMMVVVVVVVVMQQKYCKQKQITNADYVNNLMRQ